MTAWSAGVAVALAVGVGLTTMAVHDLRTMTVVVRHARATTALAVGGLATVAVVTGEREALVGAGLGAALVTGIQLLPYLWQKRSGVEAIGRADVRLAVPFGLTLGWFGLGFVVVGFAVALVTGMVYGAVWRRSHIPFVPFLAAGFWAGLAWVVVGG